MVKFGNFNMQKIINKIGFILKMTKENICKFQMVKHLKYNLLSNGVIKEKINKVGLCYQCEEYEEY